MTLTGWRAALALVLALALVALVVALAFWVAIALSIVGAVVWLNLVILPRLSQRLRMPRVALDLTCLTLLAVAGWLVGGPTGLGLGALAWLAGIALPRVAGRRLRARQWVGAAGSPTIIDVEPVALPRDRTLDPPTR